jgi:hypothetical protein
VQLSWCKKGWALSHCLRNHTKNNWAEQKNLAKNNTNTKKTSKKKKTLRKKKRRTRKRKKKTLHSNENVMNCSYS